MKKYYIAPFIRVVQMVAQEDILTGSGGDIHGPGTQPPVEDPSEWDTRRMEEPKFLDMFDFKW